MLRMILAIGLSVSIACLVISVAMLVHIIRREWRERRERTIKGLNGI